MQELNLNEIHQVSGAGLFGFIGDITMIGTTGLIGAVASLKYLSDVVLPYVGELSPEVLAITGFLASATAVYGISHQGSNTGYNAHNYY